MNRQQEALIRYAREVLDVVALNEGAVLFGRETKISDEGSMRMIRESAERAGLWSESFPRTADDSPVRREEPVKA